MAYLPRSFRATVDWSGPSAKIGADRLLHTPVIFDLWWKLMDGTRSRRWLQRLPEEANQTW
jgi:hypothetical protein